MKGRNRYGFVPHPDAEYVVGAPVEFLPEHDLTGNASLPAPLVEPVWGRPPAPAADPAPPDAPPPAPRA